MIWRFWKVHNSRTILEESWNLDWATGVEWGEFYIFVAFPEGICSEWQQGS